MKKYSVTALGEILIDFTYSGKNEDGISLFAQNAGGAPANVLAAVKKLGGESAFIGKAGDDMHGHFLRDTLKNAGISCDGLILDKNVFTTLAFVDIGKNGERSFSFARKPGADTCLTKEEVNCELIKNSKVLHVGSLSLTDNPAREATLFAIKCARENGITVSYDPNYRAPLWPDEKTACEGMRSILKYVDIIKISDEEMKLLTDETNEKKCADALFEKGISCVIITKGAQGAYVAVHGADAKIPCCKVNAVDTTGAGDSFMGAFLYKMTSDDKKASELTKSDITSYGNFAAKVSAFCVSKKGAISAMPALSDLDF